MGEYPPSRPEICVDPERLWIWDKVMYVDENRRTWLPIMIKAETGLKVLMSQEDVPLGEPLSPTQLGPWELPLMWQLYPGRRYRGLDSSFWRVVYHIEVNGREDMLLEQLPQREW